MKLQKGTLVRVSNPGFAGQLGRVVDPNRAGRVMVHLLEDDIIAGFPRCPFVLSPA